MWRKLLWNYLIPFVCTYCDASLRECCENTAPALAAICIQNSITNYDSLFTWVCKLINQIFMWFVSRDVGKTWKFTTWLYAQCTLCTGMLMLIHTQTRMYWHASGEFIMRWCFSDFPHFVVPSISNWRSLNFESCFIRIELSLICLKKNRHGNVGIHIQ